MGGRNLYGFCGNDPINGMDGLGLLGLYNLPELDPQATAAAIQAYAHASAPITVGAAKWGSETVISMDRLLAKMGPQGWLPNAYNPQLLAADWTENFLDEKFFNPITTGFDSIQGNIYAYTPVALDVATIVPAGMEVGIKNAPRIAGAGQELLAKIMNRLRSEKPPVLDASKAMCQGAANAIPQGFVDQQQFQQVGDSLIAALEQSGLKYKQVGVRGSAVTDVSSKGGGFRNVDMGGLKASDIDAFIEFADDIGLTASQKIPGFIHPDKLMKTYPALRAWSEKWTKSLGRTITPGGFKPNTFTDSDIINF